MRRHSVEYRISGGMPFDIDGLLEEDLEAHFPEFGQGQPLLWGLAVGAVDESWDEEVGILGKDWDVRFYPPKQLKIPHTNEKRMSMRSIPRHCCMLRVVTNETDMNAAREVGRPAVRSLLTLLRREMGAIIPADVVWEGAFGHTRAGMLRMSKHTRLMEAAQIADPTRLYKIGLKLARVSTLEFPPQLHQALEWLGLSRAATTRSEKFMHLWLTVLSLASYKKPKGRDLPRIQAYTNTMIVGDGGVRAPRSVEALNGRLRLAHDVRNDLMHRADDSGITEDVLRRLELDAFEFVDFELRKLGTPVSA